MINQKKLNQILYKVAQHITYQFNRYNRIFKPTKICLVGSRVRGTNTDSADIDVAIQYKGELKEEDVFNILHKEPLIIDGLRVDYIPYNESKGNRIDNYTKQIVLFKDSSN